MTSTSRQLGEVCTIIAGQHIEAALYSTVQGGSPYLTGPADFGELRPVISKWTKSPKVFAAEGDVLITVKGNGVGKTNLGCEAAIGRQLMALRPKDGELSQAYLFQYLRAAESRIFGLADGATVPGIGKDDLASLSVFLPPLQEQRRIAAILDRAEALRAKRRSALAQLDTLTQAIFLDLFGDPATNPKGWPQSTLGELVAMGPQNGLYKPASEYGSGTPILRIDAFYDGVVTKLATLKRVRISENERELYGLRPDDIVVNRVNSMEYLGKSALVPHLAEPTVFESNMMRLRVDREKAEPGYVVQFLQTGLVKSQILTAAKNAVNQSSINQRDVRAFRINVPPLPIQHDFAQRVAVVDKLKAMHRASLVELNGLFATLQHRAFRGEL